MKSLKTYSSSSRRKNLQKYSLKNVKTILWKDLLMHKNECTNGHWQMKKHQLFLTNWMLNSCVELLLVILLVLNTTFSHKDTDFPLFYNEYSDYTDDTVMTIANADWLITEERLPTQRGQRGFLHQVTSCHQAYNTLEYLLLFVYVIDYHMYKALKESKAEGKNMIFDHSECIISFSNPHNARFVVKNFLGKTKE